MIKGIEISIFFKSKIMIAFFIIHIGVSNSCFSQYFSNPSFEGTTGYSTLPSGWSACDTLSTPDTGPTSTLNVTNVPSNGSSYLVMITRGAPSPYAGYTEACQTQLTQPLLKGSCYNFKIDMANSKTYGHEYNWDDWISYPNPVAVKIYGGISECDSMELLAKFDSVPNEQWQTFEFTFSPVQADFTHI